MSTQRPVTGVCFLTLSNRWAREGVGSEPGEPSEGPETGPVGAAVEEGPADYLCMSFKAVLAERG